MARKNRMTKREKDLQAKLAGTVAALVAVTKERDEYMVLLHERDDQLTIAQLQIAGLNNRLDSRLAELMDKEDDVARLSDDLQDVRRDLRAADLAGSIISEQLHREIEDRLGEQVLIKALVATLAKGRSDQVTDVIRTGARIAGVDRGVVFEVYDKYAKADLLQKAAMEGESVPSTRPAPASFDLAGMMASGFGGSVGSAGNETDDLAGILEQLIGGAMPTVSSPRP